MTTAIVTSGGAHSAQQWAVMSTGQILQINPQFQGDLAIQARKLELELLGVLERQHKIVQDGEKAVLRDKGTAHLLTPLDPYLHIDMAEAVQDIVDKAERTYFKAHFENPEVINHIWYTLGSHFTTSMEIERDWFCVGYDNKQDEHLVAYAQAKNKTFS